MHKVYIVHTSPDDLESRDEWNTSNLNTANKPSYTDPSAQKGTTSAKNDNKLIDTHNKANKIYDKNDLQPHNLTKTRVHIQSVCTLNIGAHEGRARDDTCTHREAREQARQAARALLARQLLQPFFPRPRAAEYWVRLARRRQRVHRLLHRPRLQLQLWSARCICAHKCKHTSKWYY